MATQRASIYPPDDELILSEPVSERRKQELLDDYLRERRLTRTTEMLFARVDALEMKHSPVPESVRVFGFRAIVFKHSFIEGVNSLIVSARDWAIGQEDFLLQHLEEQLRGAMSGRLGMDVEREPLAILDALDGMTSDLQSQRYSPSAFVVTGTLGQLLFEALRGETQRPWDWYAAPGSKLRATHRLIGAHRGTPLVAISASPVPALYALDVARFATLTRYGVGPEFEPEFHVKAFTDDEAHKVLARQPNLILDPPPDSGQDEERIRQLQLRVGLELWEMYRFDVKDPGAVIARPLADPIYE